MFYRLGSFTARRARAVLAIASILVALFAIFGVTVFSHLLSGGFDDPGSASSQAKVLLDQKFGGEPDMIFLVHARSGSVDGPAVTQAGDALAARIGTDKRFANVTSYWQVHSPAMKSKDGTDALVLTKLAGDDATADKKSTRILSDYANLDTPAATVRIGGAEGTGIGKQVGKDLELAEAIAVPVTLLLLVVAFGSVVAALLPLSVGVFAIFGTLFELHVLTLETSVSTFAINLTTALGLGLGVDYALLMVSRFREELAAGRDVHDAVARTTATAGRTIAFSSLTVATSLLALLVFPVYFLRSFAYAGVAVTLLAAVAALLVLPSLLAVLGPRVNAGRVPGIKAVRNPEAPFWGRLAGGVFRHPAAAALPVIAILIFLAAPLLGVSFSTPNDQVLRSGAASHQVGDALRNDFSASPDSIDVVATPPIAQAGLTTYVADLAKLPGVTRTSVTSAAGSQRISLTTKLDSASGAAQTLVKDVRAQAPPPGAHVLVGGTTAQLIDGKHAIASRLLIAGAIIVIATFVLLFLFTGSVMQPVRALVGNVLTLGATLGAMVWIFQDGHFASLLKFTPTPTNTAIPVLVFCIAFGLSMDYEVFVISRIKELHDAGSSNQDSVVHGLARSGRIVSTAAGILAVSFFAFGTSKVSFIQFFGIGTGLAVLIDATLVRGVLVPAFMRTFGERSWWAPAPLRSLHARIGLTEGTAPV